MPKRRMRCRRLLTSGRQGTVRLIFDLFHEGWCAADAAYLNEMEPPAEQGELRDLASPPGLGGRVVHGQVVSLSRPSTHDKGENMMKNQPPGFLEPGCNELASRGIEPSPATLGSAERELGVIAFKSTKTGGELQSEAPDPGGVRPEEPSLNPEPPLVEGWVANMPVIEGVADSGWVESDRGRFRVQMVVRSSEIQRNWVRSMVFASDGETPDLV